MLSRKPGYRNPVSLMGETPGPAPCIPCPSLGLHGGWGAGLPNFIPLSWLLFLLTQGRLHESVHSPNSMMKTMIITEWTVIMTGGSLSSRCPVRCPIDKLSPFLLGKAIKSAVGTVKTLRRLRNGDFLLEISSAMQSRIVNKLDNLAGCPVTASPHRTLNTCKGVIRCAPLVDCDKEEIISEQKYNGLPYSIGRP